jgi:hypothetical protein
MFCQKTVGHVPDLVGAFGNAEIMGDDDDTISLFMRQFIQDSEFRERGCPVDFWDNLFT